MNIWENKIIYVPQRFRKRNVCRIFQTFQNISDDILNVSDLMDDSEIMNVSLACLTETQLSSTTVLRDISSTYEIVRNDDQIESLAVLYSKHNVKCLGQENLFIITKRSIQNFFTK